MPPPLRVLIVEDEGIIAMCLRMELERAGYAVAGVLATGEATVARVKQAPPDLILMDIQLAGPMDGWVAAQKIREWSLVPIVFMTGFERKSQAELSERFAPCDLVVKPLILDDIREKIGAFR